MMNEGIVYMKIRENKTGKITKIIYPDRRIDKYQYNRFGQLIYFKCFNGNEQWWRYENNNKIEITEQIKKKKEYKKFIYNVEKVSRFELMDI